MFSYGDGKKSQTLNFGGESILEHCHHGERFLQCSQSTQRNIKLSTSNKIQPNREPWAIVIMHTWLKLEF